MILVRMVTVRVGLSPGVAIRVGLLPGWSLAKLTKNI